MLRTRQCWAATMEARRGHETRPPTQRRIVDDPDQGGDLRRVRCPVPAVRGQPKDWRRAHGPDARLSHDGVCAGWAGADSGLGPADHGRLDCRPAGRRERWCCSGGRDVTSWRRRRGQVLVEGLDGEDALGGGRSGGPHLTAPARQHASVWPGCRGRGRVARLARIGPTGRPAKPATTARCDVGRFQQMRVGRRAASQLRNGADTRARPGVARGRTATSTWAFARSPPPPLGAQPLGTATGAPMMTRARADGPGNCSGSGPCV